LTSEGTEDDKQSSPKPAYRSWLENNLEKEIGELDTEWDRRPSPAVRNNVTMPIVDLLSDPDVRRMLNTDPNFERLRYLAVLAAAAEPLFETSGTIVEGKVTFNLRQLWRVAAHLGLDFERFRGADRAFKMLEKSGHLIVICDQRTEFHTQYCPTELGISQTLLTLERLKKFPKVETPITRKTIRKESTSTPKIYEVHLSQNPFTIGTDEDNDLSITDPYMSSKHALVSYDSGHWIFEDLNSTNGSWKMEPNSVRLVTREQLTDNDLFQLGSTVIRFRLRPASPTP
jgi:hypothetical protein